MKWLLLPSVLLSLGGCGTYYEPPMRRVSTLSHGTFDEPVQAQTTRIVDPNSTERGQLELERRNLDALNKEGEAAWTDYIKAEIDFAASLDDQELEAYSQEKQASKSSDIALVVATYRKFRTLLPEEKFEEYRQLLKKKVELQERAKEFGEKRDAFNQRVDAYNASEEAARQALINFFAFQQQRSLVQDQMFFNKMQQSQQQQQAQRQREQDRIWLHNELQNLKRDTYWQEQLAREQWNEKWQEK